MLVYINTSGSHGDVHPFLGIGRALAGRGHEVVVFTHPYFASDIENAGLGHVPIGSEVDQEAVLRDPRLMHPRKGGPFVMKLVMDAVPGAIEILRREIATRRPDVMLSHHICFGTRWVCEAKRIPLAIALLAPLFWFSRGDPVPAPQRRNDRLDTLRAKSLMVALRPFFSLVADRMLNRLRRQSGFTPERGVFLRDTHGGDLNLGLWSRHFRAATPDDPPAGRICGFPWYDRGDDEVELDPGLEMFLDDDGEAPIVFALGTSVVHAPGDFYEVAAAACMQLGRRGVLLTGDPDRAPGDLPDGVRAFGYTPFSRLLPRGCATVHHGGIGSTAQALRAGRPSVVVPHAHDQFNNAVRVAKLGAGTLVHRRRMTATRLAGALRDVLDDESVNERCVELSRALAGEDGSETAAAALEELAGRAARPKTVPDPDRPAAARPPSFK